MFRAAFFHKSSKLETTQLSINRRLNKQTMVPSYNGVLLSNKKERSTDAYSNLDEPQKHYVERNKPDIRVHTV